MQSNQLQTLDPSEVSQPYRTTPGVSSNLSPQANAKPLEVDFVVKNVYQKIKSLENKYIDLANYYKESAKGAEESSQGKLPRNSSQLSGQYQKESAMIKDLYEKKKDLEENIQTLKAAVQLQKTHPSLQLGQMKNTKRVISAAFAEISNSVDSSQSQCLKALAQKQNEMFQLATKHKISSAFRNETLGLWYDTKSLLAQWFSEIKQTILSQQHVSDQQLGLNFVYQPRDDPVSALDQAQLQELNDQIYKFSRIQLKQKKELSKMQASFEKGLGELKNDHQNLQSLIEELCQTQEDSSLNRRKTVDKSVYLSPFQRKLQTYSNPALGQSVLNSQKRSASKGNNTSQQKIQPTSSAQNFQSKSSRALTIQDNQSKDNLTKEGSSFTRSQLDHLKSAFKVHGLANMQQQALSEDFLNFIHKISQENSVFIQNLQSIVTRDPNNIDQKDRFQELQLQYEKIYSELRQLNEKNIDLRVENNKLREQILHVNKMGQLQNQGAENSESLFRSFLEQMCENVIRFMNAMRQLQKAVNRKDPDVAGPKELFESSKQNLQALVVEARDILNKKGAQSQQQQFQSENRQQATASTSPLREKRPTVSSTQLNKLPLLLQNVKNLQLEKQKMQELIVELKQANTHELEQMQLKSKQKSDRLQKFAAQCTYFQIKQQAQDQLLCDYRKIIVSLDSKFTEQLLNMEKQLESKIKDDVARIQPSLRLDPQVSALKDELVSQILAKTQIFEGQIEMLNSQLKLKEDALNRLKLLFVEKLHELETTFVEISNEVAETEQQHQQQAQQKRTPNQFERSVETVLSKFESDEREKDMEQLTQANAELLEQIAHLKQTLQLVDAQKKESDPQVAAKLEFVFELQDQLDTQKSLLEKQVAKAKELEQSESLLKKEIQTLKYDNKRNQFDLKDARERFEKAKNEYQAQFNGLKMTILSQKQQVDKEQELKNVAQLAQQQLQKDISVVQAQKLLRENEIKNLKDDLEQMKDQLQTSMAETSNIQRDLTEQIELAQQEIEQLKLQNFELSTKSLMQENSTETAEIVNSHMEVIRKGSVIRISAGDFTEVQLTQLVNELQEGWVLQQKQINSQLELNTELGAQIQELKVELQEATVEALDNQLKIDKLQKTSEASPTTLSLNTQLDESRNLLEFKCNEIETLIEKLGRVNQELGDYKDKINKLQDSLVSLNQENVELTKRLEAAETLIQTSKSDTEQKTLQISSLTEQIEKLTDELGENKTNGDELSAQVKHLTTKLLLEKEHSQELEQKARRLEAQIGKPGAVQADSNEHAQKLQEASSMLEDLKNDYQQLKQSSEKRIGELIEQEEKTKTELSAKYKQEMKSFLQKAVDDRKKIQSEYNKETIRLKSELELVQEQVSRNEQVIAELRQSKESMEIQHAEDKEAWHVTQSEELSEAKAELAELSETKNSMVVAFEAELRQAEEARSELQTKYEKELENQANFNQQIVSQLNLDCQILSSRLAQQEKMLDQAKSASASLSDRKIQLVIALQIHLRKLVAAKFDQLTLDFENQQIYTQNLERNTQQAEYKQLQQEGELRRVEEEFKKYKVDANKLMMENLKRQSELKKTDEAKNLEIATLTEYQSNLQEQIVDYASQIQKLESETEKLIEHVQELQGELNVKEQQLQQSSPKKQVGSPEKQSLHERKIQELLDLNQQYEEQLSLMKTENEKLKKPGDEKRNSWEFQNSGGRGSWGSNGGVPMSQEVEDVLKHIRQIMTTFLVKLPFSTKENEDILPILFSMLHFQQGELDALTQQREDFNKQNDGKQKGNETSKNIFGFGKKKQQKK